jgi:hypothetical protein
VGDSDDGFWRESKKFLHSHGSEENYFKLSRKLSYLCKFETATYRIRGYVTSRKVAGSSPDEAIGFFQLT